MAQLDERLERLLSDKDSMKKVLDMANAIMGQRSEQTSTSDNTPAVEGEIVQPGTDAADMLRELLAHSSVKDTASTGDENTGGKGAEGVAEEAKGVAGIAAVLPMLLQAFSGNGDLVSDERLNLIRAMKPYMADKRLGNVDRAIRMANIAVAAKAALGILGR